MASELRVNTLKDASGNNSVATSTVAEGTMKCWIKFDQNTENEVKDSFNTSSVSDESTGRAYWNNTNAFANTNGGMYGVTARTGIPKLSGVSAKLQRSTSQWDINTTQDATDNYGDCEWSAGGIGDLA